MAQVYYYLWIDFITVTVIFKRLWAITFHFIFLFIQFNLDILINYFKSNTVRKHCRHLRRFMQKKKFIAHFSFQIHVFHARCKPRLWKLLLWWNVLLSHYSETLDVPGFQVSHVGWTVLAAKWVAFVSHWYRTLALGWRKMVIEPMVQFCGLFMKKYNFFKQIVIWKLTI